MNKVKGNKLGRNLTGKQQIGNKNNQRDHIEEYENNSNRNKSQILADTQFISQSSISNLSIKKVVLFLYICMSEDFCYFLLLINKFLDWFNNFFL